MCQSKEQGGRRCANALMRQRNKQARITAEAKAEETGFASISLIASPAAIKEHLEKKLIVSRQHPDFPELSIYCYSIQAQADNHWDPITIEARGIIVNNETNEIVARPFGKFFNYGQDVKGLTDFPKTGKMEVMEKADGSLGIMYKRPDGKTAIATKGSMDSDQARQATEIYNKKYEGTWNPDPDYTYCFEYIHPDNRIVIDYGDTEGLMLLGARHKVTGKSMTQEELDKAGWKGMRPKIHSYSSLSEVIEAQNEGIRGEEGFVVNFVDHDKKVKFKFKEYLDLHRNVSNVNVNRIYEAYVKGEDIKKDVPDEFYSDVEKVTNHYDGLVKDRKAQLEQQYDEVVNSLPKGYTQKDLAQASFSKSKAIDNISSQAVAKYILNKHKGQDRHREIITNSFKPYGNVGISTFLKKIGEK